MMGRHMRAGVTAAIGIVLLCCASPALVQEPAPGWEMRVCAGPDNLPYSNREREGFENRIAEILADELGAELTYVWYIQLQHSIGYALRSGRCDMVMRVVDASAPVLTTLPYYRSSAVFVYPKDAPFEIASFDDPGLKDLVIGVPLGGGHAMPPNLALARRGLLGNRELYPVLGNDSENAGLSPLVGAVTEGEVDVAVVPGPVAGYFAKRQGVPLEIVPVSPQFLPPFVSMVSSISIGLRNGDRDFARLLNRALITRWSDIQAVLKQYNVPLLPLAKPKLTLKGG